MTEQSGTRVAERPWVVYIEDDGLMGNRFISLLQQEPVNMELRRTQIQFNFAVMGLLNDK